MAIISRKTHTLDAEKMSLGRLSSEIARLLQGKNKAIYAPNRDVGDIVIVKNLSAISFSGKKFDQKIYHHFSGYPGGITSTKLKVLWGKDPAAVLRRVVTQMLPDNTLRRKWLTRLKVK